MSNLALILLIFGELALSRASIKLCILYLVYRYPQFWFWKKRFFNKSKP